MMKYIYECIKKKNDRRRLRWIHFFLFMVNDYQPFKRHFFCNVILFVDDNDSDDDDDDDTKSGCRRTNKKNGSG